MNSYRSLYLRWIGITAPTALIALPLDTLFSYALSPLIIHFSQSFFVLRKLEAVRHPLLWAVVPVASILLFSLYEYFELPSLSILKDGSALYFFLAEGTLGFMFGTFTGFCWSAAAILSLIPAFYLRSLLGIESFSLLNNGAFDISFLLYALLYGLLSGAGTGLAILFILRKRETELCLFPERSKESPPLLPESEQIG